MGCVKADRDCQKDEKPSHRVELTRGRWMARTEVTVEAFPDPTDTQVQIITPFPGQPTEEVERRVSIPLEQVLNGTPGLFRLRSISLFGLSMVTLTFQDGMEPLPARQQVLERVSQAELPEGVQPGLGPLYTPIGEVYRYTLIGSHRRSHDIADAPGLDRTSPAAARTRRGGRRVLWRSSERDPRSARPVQDGFAGSQPFQYLRSPAQGQCQCYGRLRGAGLRDVRHPEPGDFQRSIGH